MSELSFHSLKSLPESLTPGAISASRRIFHGTSSRTSFSSEQEKADFEWKYFGVYLSTKDSFWLALREESVVGYLAGAPRTLPLHFELNPYLNSFRASIEESFPAHLHLNLSPESQGLGIGSRLLSCFLRGLSSQLVPGVHVVVAQGERNVSFYQRNGFQEVARAPKGNATLLLLGRPLTPA